MKPGIFHLLHVLARVIMVLKGGDSMTGSELIRLLRKNGWIITEGKRHHLATHPARPGVKIPVARHKSKEIPSGTLQEILRHARLK